MVSFAFYADLEPLIGQQVEVLTRKRQYQGKLLALHKQFIYVGTKFNQDTHEWEKDVVWLTDITNLRSLAE